MLLLFLKTRHDRKLTKKDEKKRKHLSEDGTITLKEQTKKNRSRRAF